MCSSGVIDEVELWLSADLGTLLPPHVLTCVSTRSYCRSRLAARDAARLSCLPVSASAPTPPPTRPPSRAHLRGGTPAHFPAFASAHPPLYLGSPPTNNCADVVISPCSPPASAHVALVSAIVPAAPPGVPFQITTSRWLSCGAPRHPVLHRHTKCRQPNNCQCHLTPRLLAPGSHP